MPFGASQRVISLSHTYPLTPLLLRTRFFEYFSFSQLACFACFAMDVKYLLRYTVGGNAAAKALSLTPDRKWAAVCRSAALSSSDSGQPRYDHNYEGQQRRGSFCTYEYGLLSGEGAHAYDTSLIKPP